MRKFTATVATALALAGVCLATHTATSEATAEAIASFHILPYIEQDNLFKIT